MEGKRKRVGFTLVEVIVVISILAMLAVMVVPNLQNLFLHSRQTARNSVARSIYLAAQSALTNRYSQGDAYKKSYLNLTQQKVVDLTGIDGVTQQEKTDNADNIYFISIDQGGGDPNNAVETLIAPYLGDPEVLNHAILIEFNVQTGNVLSVFYSDDEEVSGFSYGTGGYNVRNRSAAALEAGFVGYFAVEYTGKVLTPTPIGSVTVRLIDDIDPNSPTYGLLLAECVLPSVYSEKFSFELMLEPQVGSPSTVPFTNDPANTGSVQLSAIKQILTLDAAVAQPISVGTRSIPVWFERRGANEVLTFVLDGVQDGLQLSSNFSGVGCGFLSASFSVTDGADTVTAFSNLVHSYFQGKVLADPDGSLGIASVRHLNNIRLHPSGVFKQTAAVAVKNYNGTALNFVPLCTLAQPFTGAYNGANKKIEGLRSAGLENAALFNYIAPSGSVKNVWLDRTTNISAVKLAGGVACVNAGTISHCSVFGASIVTSAAGSGTNAGFAGGVAAWNEQGGVIERCYTGVNVTGHNAAGGVAGVNSGRVSYCEVGTASIGGTAVGGALAAGCFPHYGAALGTANYLASSGRTVENNVWTVEVLESGGAAGGIVGKLPDSKGKVQLCVNADQVKGGNVDKYTGGVVGLVESTVGDGVSVQNSYNAGSVFGAGAAGGVVGQLSGEISGCYNAGTVNVEVEAYPKKDADPVAYDTLVRFLRTHNIDLATGFVNQSGGILGYGTADSKASYCYSAMYAGSRFGGAFGLMDGVQDHCFFRTNIYNNTTTYYTSGGTTSLDTLRISGARLRNAFDGSIFRNGVLLGGGVGPFRYQFPYLEGDGLNAGTLHRTPWKNVVESEGVVRLENTANDGILLTVMTLRDEADLYFGNNAVSDLNTYIEFHISRIAFKFAYAGTDSAHPGTITQTNGSQAQYDIYRIDVNENDRALGYEHAYVIKLSWDDLDDNTAVAAAKLYGPKSIQGSDLLDSTSLARPYGMTFLSATDSQGRPYTYLELSITDLEQQARPVSILYQGAHAHQSFSIDLSVDNLNTPATSYADAYDKYMGGGADSGKVSAAFDGGHGGGNGVALLWKSNGKLYMYIFGGERGNNSLFSNATFCSSITVNGIVYNSTNNATTGN